MLTKVNKLGFINVFHIIYKINFKSMKKENINKIVGRTIKELRKKNSLTQLELSEKTWLSRTTISQIETWDKSPTLNTLESISKALEIEIKELFDKWNKWIHIKI